MPEDHTGASDSENTTDRARTEIDGSRDILQLDRRSGSLADTERIVHEFFQDCLQKLPAGAVLLIEGELGAGKTAFCRCIGRELGIIGQVNSPTFNLLHQHQGERGILYHYDLYRIGEASLEELEFRDFWDGPVQDRFTIHAIEWWQRAGTVHSRLPIFRVLLALDTESPENSRWIRIYRRND